MALAAYDDGEIFYETLTADIDDSGWTLKDILCMAKDDAILAADLTASLFTLGPSWPVKWFAIGAGVAYGVKNGLQLASLHGNCDSSPFNQIISHLKILFERAFRGLWTNFKSTKKNHDAILKLQEEMEKGFKKIGNMLDKILFEIYQNYHAIVDVSEEVNRNYAGIRKTMQYVERNFDAIFDDGLKSDTILQTIIERFHSVNEKLDQTSNEEIKWFKKLERLIRRRHVQDKTSELASVLKEFEEIREDLGHGSLVDKLTGDDGYHKYFKHGKTPKSTTSLYTLLNDILNEEIAVPKNTNDDAAYKALYLLFQGTNTYIRMFQYVMAGNALAMKENQSKSDVEKYNQRHRDSVAEFRTFQNILCGIGSEDGLISEVIRALSQIQKLHFIKDQPHVSVILSQMIKYYRDIEKRFANMIYKHHDKPTNRIRSKPNDSGINTPFLDWRDARRVRYAVQYVSKADMSSPISDWSVPFTIDGKASPVLDIGDAPSGTTRVIFRQFDHDQPKLVGVVYDPDQTEFQDLDRDLYDAALESNQHMAKMNVGALIEKGANVTAKFENGRQVIHAAAKTGNKEVLRDLLKKGVDINARDGAGFSPLHIAAESGDKKVVQDLISLGADVGASSHLNWTASHVAAKHGHVKTLKVLEQANLNARAAGGFTPLHMAVNSRRIRAVGLLISNEKTDVNAQSDKLLTPLHLAVLGLDKKTVQMLLSNAKCDVNIRAHGGLSALHLAVMSGDENIVEQLMRNNATNINAKSDEGWSSLHLAISLRKRGIVEKLLNSTRINVNLEGKDKITPLQLANSTGQEAIILDLINHGAQVKLERSPIPSSQNNAPAEEVAHFVNQEQEALQSHPSGKNSSDIRSNSTNFHPGNLHVHVPAQGNTSAESQNTSRVSSEENLSLLGTAVPSDQLSYSPLMVNNILLAKWLLHMFGRRSFVEGMTKVEALVENLWQEDAHGAEKLLRQGKARYGQL